MKKVFQKIVSLTACTALLCTALLGCGPSSSAPEGGSLSDPPSSSLRSEEPKESSGKEEENPVTSLPSEPVSSAPSRFVPEINSDDESIPPEIHSSAPVTENDDFNQIFARNPLDSAYSLELKNASSTKEIVEAAEKFAAVWRKEITFCYNRLLTLLPEKDAAALISSQGAWEAKTESVLAQIQSEAAAAGNSMAQVAASDNTLAYFRARAAALYNQLFLYDSNFSYAYEG